MPENNRLALCECIFVITSQLTNIYSPLELFEGCVGIVNAHLSLSDVSFKQRKPLDGSDLNLAHRIPLHGCQKTEKSHRS